MAEPRPTEPQQTPMDEVELQPDPTYRFGSDTPSTGAIHIDIPADVQDRLIPSPAIAQEAPSSDDEDDEEDASAADLRATARSSAYQLPKTTEMELTWQDIHYSVTQGRGKKKQTKVILDGVSGMAKPGQLLAIMGSSGAGKTTLLNMLAGRVASGKITGEILVNGQKRSKRWKRHIGYVEQDDVMYETLTVKETLQYSAYLRLPGQMSTRAKKERVRSIMQSLGLNKCPDTRIGGPQKRGVSGGERKRVSVGTELVTNPAVLFLDEPTTGLDAFTAYALVQCLVDLAREGKTVICTIHQPRTDILYLFDRLLLMSMGRVVFEGTVPRCMRHFERLGLSCSELMNPADYWMDQITIDKRSEEARALSTDRVNMLLEAWRRRNASSMASSHGKGSMRSAPELNPLITEVISEDLPRAAIGAELETAHDQPMPKQPKWNVSWPYEFRTLLRRAMLDVRRDVPTIVATCMSSLILMLLIGFTFFQLPLNQVGIQSRVGVLFFLAINLTFTTIQPILTLFPEERRILLRERYAGMYRLSAFFMAKSVSVLPLRLTVTLLYGLSIYYIIGLNPGAAQYFIFQGITISLVFSSLSLGLLVASICPTVRLAQIFGPLLLVVFLIYAGNLANPDTIPPELRWLQYLSLVRYAYMAYFQNEFTGLTFTCDDGSDPDQNACNPGFKTGEEVIAAYGLNQFPVFLCCLILVGFGFAYQLLAYIALRYTSKPKMVIA